MISSVEAMRHYRALRRFPKAFSLDLRQEFGHNGGNRSARLDLYGWEWAGSLSRGVVVLKEIHSWYDHMWYTDPLKCDVGLIEKLLLCISYHI